MESTAKASSLISRSASQPPRTSQSRRAFLKASVGTLALSTFSTSFLTACGGNLDVDQPSTPRLASVDNFRDVAGAAGGYPTVDGKQVRRGVFYRASVLTLSSEDKTTLDKLGIAAVYDLRTPAEIARIADILPVGAISQAINILGTNDVTQPTPDSAAVAVTQMETSERAYVTGTAQCAGYGQLLTQLADAPGVQLFHSSAGKDRAGWVAALLLSIANVPVDVIMQDYLLSNVYDAPSIQAATAVINVQQGDAAALNQAPLLGVQDSFLQAGFDQVQASYGTMASYLMQGLGLTPATIKTLHDRLVS